MSLLERLAFALELYGNIALAQRFVEKYTSQDDLTLLIEQASRPSYRRYMDEETRPIYLLPALKCVLQEHRQLYWVMMGADTNHLAWQALTDLLNVEHTPLLLKVKAGGPHHGDRDDPASTILSLLTSEEATQNIDTITQHQFRQWMNALPQEHADQPVRTWMTHGEWLEGSRRDAVRVLMTASADPSLRTRWEEISPQFLLIQRIFEDGDFADVPLDDSWFEGRSLYGQQFLQRIHQCYWNKALSAQRDPMVLDTCTFELLRHAFSEILGEQVVISKERGLLKNWQWRGMHILLEQTEWGQRIRQFSPSYLFWENGLWTGRTYFALAMALHAFSQFPDWKFGIHTSYPYISGISALVDVQTTRTLEGVEDVQGLGNYLRISTKNAFRFVTYDQWLNEHHTACQAKTGHLFNQLIDSIRYVPSIRSAWVSALQRLPLELLIRLYLREEDYHHPDEDHITFKYVLHSLYADQQQKVSYRAIYFPLQNLFKQIREHEKRNPRLFVQLRHLNDQVCLFEERAMVQQWLRYRANAIAQVQAGIDAIKRHQRLVSAYLRDELPYRQLVEQVIPTVCRVDVRDVPIDFTLLYSSAQKS